MPDENAFRLRAAGKNDVDEISQLSIAIFGEDGASQDVVAQSVVTWQENRSPLVVARDSDGSFLGYATAKPNRAGEFWRIDGQVAILTHVAVVPTHRSRGVGTALVERTVKTARLLGWERMMAQVPAELVTWYRDRGWTVHPADELLAWVEPWLPRDDLWYPEKPSRAFSPLLFLAPRDDYPHLAVLQMGGNPPLLEVTASIGHGNDNIDDQLGTATAAALRQQPDLARVLPRELVRLINQAVK